MSDFQLVQGEFLFNGFGISYTTNPGMPVKLTILTGNMGYTGQRHGIVDPQSPTFRSAGAATISPGLPVAYLEISVAGDFTTKRLFANMTIKDTEQKLIGSCNDVIGSWNVTVGQALAAA